MKQHRVKLFVFALFVVGYLVAALTPGIREQLTLEAARAHLDTLTDWAHRSWGPLAYMGATVVFMLVQAPGLIMVVIGALVYPPLLAFAYSTLASIIGSTLTFFLFRYLLRDWAEPRLKSSPIGPHIGRVERHGVAWMIVIRFVFALSPWINWLMGATKIPTRDYLFGNAVGIAIVILTVQTLTGAAESAGRGEWNWTQTAVAAALLLAFAGTALILRKTMLAPKADATAAESER